MKKLFAAALAAVLIISAAGCAKTPAQQEEPAVPVQEETAAPETPAADALWVDKKNLRLKLWDGEQWQMLGYEPEEPDPEPTEPTEPTTPTDPETPDIEKPGSEDKDTENKEETDNKETDQEGGSS